MEYISHPIALVLPKVTTTVRDTLKCEPGTVIFNTTTNRINVCKTASTGATNWLVSASV